ncbi:MAG: hypothetical protein PVH03_12495 [Chloroflexota bacterium]|jgi:hypothetical protein
MEDSINKLEEIWTAEDKKLGLAKYLYHRQSEINPKLQLYARYLEVENFEYGDDYYVPTDFIEGRDPESGKIRLSLSFDEVMKRTWFRMPDFIAHGDCRREELPTA